MAAPIFTRIAAFPALARAYFEYIFSDADFIALQALAPVFVGLQKGKYTVVDAARMLIQEDLKRAPGSAYARPNTSLSEAEWDCDLIGAEFPLPRETIRYLSSQMQVDLLAMRSLAGLRLMAMEADAASALFNTSTWTATTVSTAWSTASADIIGDVLTAKETVRGKTGKPANALIIAAGVLPSLLKNTGIRQSVFYNSVPTVPALLGALPGLLGLEKILVGGGINNTAAEGQTKSTSDIWDNGYAQVCRVATTADITEPCVGRTFFWTGAGIANGAVKVYEENQTNSLVYQINDAYDQRITQADMGELLDITP